MKDLIISICLGVLIVLIGTLLIGALSGSYWIGFLATALSVALWICEERRREKRLRRSLL